MDASAHRANARQALQGNWANAVLVSLLAGLITGSGISLNITITDSGQLQYSVPENMESLLHDILGIAMPLVLAAGGVMLVIGLILGGVMDLGLARYNLNLIDRKPAQLNDLFTGFPRFLQAMLMNLLRTVLTVLGYCLLVIPGVMLLYGFAMAPYILAEDPECTGWEALRRSLAMMRGRKLELFWLELTFIGWQFLAAFTFGVGKLFLDPYIAASRASFFRDLQNQGYAPAEDF